MMGIKQEAILRELTCNRKREGFIVEREERAREVDREEARVA